MTPKPRFVTNFMIALAVTLATWVSGSSGNNTEVQEHLDSPAARWLDSHPGGTLTGPTELTYGPSDGPPLMIVNIEPTPGSTADCPADHLCLYAGVGYGYPRVTTTGCGLIDLARTGWARRTHSVRNNLPGGPYEAGKVTFHRSDSRSADEVPSDDNQHQILVLKPASRTVAATPPNIDYLYHYC